MNRKKVYKYPTLTVRISNEHRNMIEELKNIHYINISQIFRDTIKKVYWETKNAKKN